MMSGSVDSTNVLYTLNSVTAKYEFVKQLKLHQDFVMDIIPNVQGTGFFSAGKDKTIYHIDLEGNP